MFWFPTPPWKPPTANDMPGSAAALAAGNANPATATTAQSARNGRFISHLLPCLLFCGGRPDYRSRDQPAANPQAAQRSTSRPATTAFRTDRRRTRVVGVHRVGHVEPSAQLVLHPSNSAVSLDPVAFL